MGIDKRWWSICLSRRRCADPQVNPTGQSARKRRAAIQPGPAAIERPAGSSCLYCGQADIADSAGRRSGAVWVADEQVSTPIRSISAITLATHDMASAVRFYRGLGFALRYGGERAAFTSFQAGPGYLNLIAQPEAVRWSWWGRVIFYVDDVDALHAHALDLGLRPAAPPRDAEWGERFFHLTDPDGHELSFARPLQP
jgi:catechol 2,3-dioxygenase-like lactoylglutathione lyase family enzyme